MSCCNEADLNDLVCCCSGKTTALTLSVLFFLTGGSLAGSLIWQYYQYYDPNFPYTHEFAEQYLYLLAIPSTFLLSTIGLCCLLGCHKKFCMFICILWPIAVSAMPGYFIYMTFEQYYEMAGTLAKQAGHVAKTNIVIIMLPICSAVAILLSIYCILLLCCLAMCARPEGGRESDIFDLELGSFDEELSEETEQKTDKTDDSTQRNSTSQSIF